MDISNLANQLAVALSNTREFAKLYETKTIIMQNPQLYRRLTEFQNKQEYILNSNFSEPQMQRHMTEINAEYNSLVQIPEVNEYFKANEAFGNLFNQTVNSIQSALDSSLAQHK